jgi:hypothetical protein
MARDTSPAKVPFRDRLRQIGTAFTFTRRHDPKVVPLLALAVLGPILAGVVLCLIIGLWLSVIPLAVLLGIMAGLLVFSRRAMTATYNEIEGQPGAAAGLLQNLRGDWRVSPAVQANAAQDMVHRVIGRPGVVLVGEGTSGRLKGLLAQERKRVQRVAGEIPVYLVTVGDGDDQVGLRKLQNHLYKLPKNVTGKQVNALDKRLTAIGGINIPLPKGPLPRSVRMPRNAKMPRR